MNQKPREITSDELRSIEALRRSREWLIAALLVLVVATCWISWHAGSPLVAGIREYDVVAELMRLTRKGKGAPVVKVP
jgi:hypothetical protein